MSVLQSGQNEGFLVIIKSTVEKSTKLTVDLSKYLEIQSTILNQDVPSLSLPSSANIIDLKDQQLQSKSSSTNDVSHDSSSVSIVQDKEQSPDIQQQEGAGQKKMTVLESFILQNGMGEHKTNHNNDNNEENHYEEKVENSEAKISALSSSSLVLQDYYQLKSEPATETEEVLPENLDYLSLPSKTVTSHGSTVSLNSIKTTTTTTTTTTNTTNSPRKKSYKEFSKMRGKTFMMPKPQLKFSPRIVNDDSPFQPKLTSKPNSKGPWTLQEIKDPDTGKIQYEHPYKIEIETWNPTPLMQTFTAPILPPKNLIDTPYKYVKTYEQLQGLIQDLSQVTEFGFDVEHSDRSYMGLTCIIQISTRSTDYIVDCFTLRNNLHTLNVVFTHPKILKIAHSADSDVKNLQRDFGLYVVGLFDTSEAAKVINGNPKRVGLGALLSQYLNVDVDKTYQLADWRIRPIPGDMIQYARADSHYLMNLYDLMKQQLLASGTQDLLLQVYENSKQICILCYEKPSDELRSSRKFGSLNMNNQESFALTELHKWRVAVARKEDDNVEIIASTKLITSLATELPATEPEIIATVKQVGGWRICGILERDIKKILKIIVKAKAMPLIIPEKKEKNKVSKGSPQFFETEVPNILFFPVKSAAVNSVEVVKRITESLIIDNPLPNFPICLQAILPVSATCEKELPTIYLELQTLLAKQDFAVENPAFTIFNNFDQKQQHELISSVKVAVAETKPSWKFVQYDSDFCILIFGVGRLCCLSIITK